VHMDTACARDRIDERAWGIRQIPSLVRFFPTVADFPVKTEGRLRRLCPGWFFTMWVTAINVRKRILCSGGRSFTMPLPGLRFELESTLKNSSAKAAKPAKEKSPNLTNP
jgi:hypothetical protein